MWQTPLYCQILDGLIVKIDSLDDGVVWVGLDGLIVVDDVGFGEVQDRLRAQGYAVVGGSAGGDLLENDRPFCQQLLAGLGVKTVPIHHFDNRKDTNSFLRQNPGKWVLKQNGQSDRTFCYVGQLDDNRDVLDLLEYYGRKSQHDNCHFILQQRIEGVELAVGRYFNGTDWVGPMNLNIEHKKLFPGDLGPKTSEMGTLMWYDDNENNRLFQEVLAPLASYLRHVDYRGPIDINCIVNENGAFPLEATSRFGYPTVELQTEFHQSRWTDFLHAIARGESYNLEWQGGYGVVVLIAIPPFPFDQCVERIRPLAQGLKIHFHKKMTVEEMRHLHFEEITAQLDKEGRESYHICSDSGYVMHVSALGQTVEQARENVYRRIRNIVIPKMFYRTDIGVQFLEKNRMLLEKWRYI